MYCGLCKHFYNGLNTKTGKLCKQTNKLISYDSYQCDEFNLTNYFFCRPSTHFISKAMCVNRKEKKMYPQCKTCKIGIYFTPLTINNQKIKRHKQILKRRKPLLRRGV